MMSDLERALGYVFQARAKLDLALTHVGAAKQRTASYQRLEFLGDRVLGMAVAAMLYDAFPQADEGELSRRLAELVRKESCAAVAARWGAEVHIRLGPGEGGNLTLKRAILADICEAVIGAVYLDGGWKAAEALVRRSFQAQMQAPLRPLRDAKTTLQEWVQSKGLEGPVYRESGRTGPDHEPEFTVVVAVAGMSEAEAKGRSKRIAEQAAAAVLLEREGLLEPPRP